MSRFVKISAKGRRLAASAQKWVAVLDTTTGLTWAVEDQKVPNWKAGADYAKTLKVAGFKDWRVPSVEELFLLADRTKHSPAIDSAFFPKCKSDWYWSSSPAACSPSDCAWFVYFYDGGAYWDGRGSSGFVRAVRAGQ